MEAAGSLTCRREENEMSDPRYSHKFEPNREGKCKRIVGGEICHEGEESIVHRRREDRSLRLQSANFVVELSYRGCSWPALKQLVEEAIESLEEVTIVRVGDKLT